MGKPSSNYLPKAPTGALHITNTMCHFWSAAAPMFCFFTQPNATVSQLSLRITKTISLQRANQRNSGNMLKCTHVPTHLFFTLIKGLPFHRSYFFGLTTFHYQANATGASQPRICLSGDVACEEGGEGEAMPKVGICREGERSSFQCCPFPPLSSPQSAFQCPSPLPLPLLHHNSPTSR